MLRSGSELPRQQPVAERGLGGNATGWSPLSQRAERTPGTSLVHAAAPGRVAAGAPGYSRACGGGREAARGAGCFYAAAPGSAPPGQSGRPPQEARHLGLLDTVGNWEDLELTAPSVVRGG